MDEKLAYHPSVDVFFQKNAWVDSEVCREWINNTLKHFVDEEKLSRFVLLLDNLSCQQSDAFKEKVSEIGGVCWYGLKDATDLWQPVDAGYAETLKKLVSIQQRDWLDLEENADRWYDGKSFKAKERRILITEWAGKAWDQLSQPQYDHLRLSCWRSTGCLLTADGSEDHLVKPEDLTDYQVPPPSLCDPFSQAPTQPTSQGTDEQVDVEEENFEEEIGLNVDTELVEAEVEDGNIFEMLDECFI